MPTARSRIRWAAQYETAIRDYDQAIELFPDFAVALNNRAWAYFKWGRAPPACRDVQRSLQLDPFSPHALDTRAHIHQTWATPTARSATTRRRWCYGGQRMVTLYQCGLKMHRLYSGPNDGVIRPELLQAIRACVAKGGDVRSAAARRGMPRGGFLSIGARGMTATVLSLLDAGKLAEFHARGLWRTERSTRSQPRNAAKAPERTALRDRYRALTWARRSRPPTRSPPISTARGLRPGQRVAFWMPDRIESVIAMLASSRCGLVCCPSPHRNHTIAEVQAMVERMRVAAFIYQPGFGADARAPGRAHAIEAAIADIGCGAARLPAAAAVGRGAAERAGAVRRPARCDDRQG